MGKHASKNQGVSVVREGRELEINSSFVNRYEPTERWWGIEVKFPRGLDEVFGVTNNKQAATAFQDLSLSQLAKDAEMDKAELRSEMKIDGDPRLIIIEICDAIDNIRKALRSDLKAQTKGVRRKRKEEEGDRGEEIGGEVISDDGLTGESDEKKKSLSDEEIEREIKQEVELDYEYADKEDKDEIANSWKSEDKTVIFNSAPFKGSDLIYDVGYPGGKLKITINSNHNLYEHFIKHLEKENETGFDCLKLLFIALARIEDTMSRGDDKEKRRFEGYRKSWGSYVNDMISKYNDDDI